MLIRLCLIFFSLLFTFQLSNAQITKDSLYKKINYFLDHNYQYYHSHQDQIIQNNIQNKKENANSTLFGYLLNFDIIKGNFIDIKLIAPKYYQYSGCEYAKAFGQKYILELTQLYLHKNKSKIDKNLLFDELSADQKKCIITSFDVNRFYNADTVKMRGGLPTNYFALAALVATTSYELGVEKDKKMIRVLLEKCISNLTDVNNGYMDDDNKSKGRFDRYGHEYIRFLWKSCQLMGYHDLLKKLTPIAQKHAQLWWNSFDPKLAASSNYGRSLQNTWDDVFEQVAFWIVNPKLRPTTVPNLLSAYHLSLDYFIKNEFDTTLHINKMLNLGKGTYSYAGKDRIFEYSLGTLNKIIISFEDIKSVIDKEKLISIPFTPELKLVNHFFSFKNKESKSGIWVYRSGNIFFNIPILGNMQNSDYQPVPYGIQGMETPVAENQFYGLNFKLIQDDNTYYFAHGLADDIQFDSINSKLKIKWNYLTKNFKNKNTLDSNFTAIIEYIFKNGELTMTQSITSKKNIENVRWSNSLATSYNMIEIDSTKIKATDLNKNLVVKLTNNYTWINSIYNNTFTNKYLAPFNPIKLVLNNTSNSFNIEQNKSFSVQYQLILP